jgi:hypothetical protein
MSEEPPRKKRKQTKSEDNDNPRDGNSLKAMKREQGANDPASFPQVSNFSNFV